ncbi:hypothetical protein OC842_001413 [Tilletia horrida]|uniref:Nuclear rim protein 1 n=1 Tax=Tilletia horrida TaxID=155126 RepID=A0AAN6GF43_9BASI|nr:hypothetical protein OC842_001413 [Tilletia horrida]
MSSTRTPRKTLAGSPLIRSGAAPHRLAGRASDSFLAQRPSNSSPGIPHSPSTPYHQFAAAQRNRLYQNHQPASSSPFAIAADNSALSLDEYGSNSSSPAFRKGAVHGFVSGVKPRASAGPGIVTLRGTGGALQPSQQNRNAGPSGNAEQPKPSSPKRQRYVRQVPLSQKLKQWPIDIINTLYLRYMVDFSPSVIIYETTPTLPLILGALLHLLSLLACVVLNPGTPVTTEGLVRSGAKAVAGAAGAAAVAGLGSGSGKGSLFRQSKGKGFQAPSIPPAAHLPDGAIPDLRSLARSRQEDWMRWTSILLTLALLLTASGVAYKLFTTTRTYTFWLRSEADKMRSSRAKLVPLSLDEDVEPPPLKERLQAWALKKLREVPVLGWFLGPEPVVESAGTTKMYSLEAWNPPTMLLKLFCTSNAASASLLTRFFALVLWPALHVAVSAQLYALVHFFKMLQQDQTLIQSEAMREYDEKFVFPHAMPMMRDASTMTHQAETIDFARDFRGGIVLPSSLLTRSHQSVPNLQQQQQQYRTATAERVDAASGGIEEEEDGLEAGDSSFGSDLNGSPSVRRFRPGAGGGGGGVLRKPSRLRSALVEAENEEEEDDGEEEEDELEDGGAEGEEEEEEEEEEEDANGGGGNVFQSGARSKARVSAPARSNTLPVPRRR